VTTAAPPLPLEVRGMTIGHGNEPVQRDLSFGVRRGEILVIMGDSGSGKSTLMRHMIGFKV
jgi:ABC-type transporter Mla maintaining outer membrane lipid asymmetry ATPase subunit MlaF